MKEKILIVDDEREICDLVELYLSNEDYEIYKFYNGADAKACIEERELDLAILDVMLPDIDGMELCRFIRESHNYPIIMLTARVEDRDKIQGLTVGADDYITKPFNPLELSARVKTQLRRYHQYNRQAKHKQKTEEQQEYNIQGLHMEKDTFQCTWNGEQLVLTPLEFRILWHLCEHRGQVVSSEELYEAVWGEKYYDSNNTVMAHIARIREKMHEQAKNPKLIQTVWGMGYMIK
ncbi:MAG: VanR-ABDEGLN family response regulator transcription factor [Lachnospiraceae bacterium]|nr:VanR-ABDEGLN family response regulator transcription factor [Lachnospiraceae bacterium]